MNKDIQNKIRSCKELQGKDIADIIAMPLFRDNLAAYWIAQKEDRNAIRKSYEAMRRMGGARGYKIPAHPIDDLAELSVEDLAVEYAMVVAGGSKRNAAERKYISQIGQQAYNLTIAKIVCKEFPELELVLIPKSKNAN